MLYTEVTLVKGVLHFFFIQRSPNETTNVRSYVSRPSFTPIEGEHDKLGHSPVIRPWVGSLSVSGSEPSDFDVRYFLHTSNRHSGAAGRKLVIGTR